jgi:hypothetical protein
MIEHRRREHRVLEGPLTRVMYATSEKKENVALSGGGRAGFPSLACGPDFVVAVWEQDGVKAKVLGK